MGVGGIVNGKVMGGKDGIWFGLGGRGGARRAGGRQEVRRGGHGAALRPAVAARDELRRVRGPAGILRDAENRGPELGPPPMAHELLRLS